MTRDRILAAARAVLEREGIKGLTIRKVAARAKLSPMALYRHFADRDALVDALMVDGLAAWESIVRELHADDPLEWLSQFWDAYLEFALTQPHRFDAAFFLPAPQARRYPDDFAAGRSPAITMAMIRIDRAMSEGRLSDRPAHDVALTLAALAQGFISMYRAGRFSSERQFKLLYRAALHQCLDTFSTRPSGRSQ